MLMIYKIKLISIPCRPATGHTGRKEWLWELYQWRWFRWKWSGQSGWLLADEKFVRREARVRIAERYHRWVLIYSTIVEERQ